MRLDRRFFLLGAAAELLVCAGVPAAWAQDVSRARAPIMDLYAALEKTMRAGPAAPFKSRFDGLAPTIERVFDLMTILQVSVGPRFASFDEAIRTRLAEAFRRFTVATYVANFDKFDGERFEVGTNLRAVGADQVVPSRILPMTGDPVRLDYLMRQSAAGWRVVDVLLDGTISRVAVQRSDFRALLARGDATPLIDSLDRKVVDLSGGALK